MKIIINEKQIKQIIQNELSEEMSYNLLTENLNLNNLKNNIRKLLIRGIAITTVIYAINSLNINNDDKEYLTNYIEQEALKIKQQEEQRKQDSITNIKINACKKYIETALKNKGYNENSTKLNPESLVYASEKYSFDLPLLLAAAHLESCFGATPRARRTNSVYSVGSYDNGKNMTTYLHPDDSIDGYIKLLNNDYLINGKTINDLLKPGGFINKNGHRYASEKNYEKTLRNIRNKIIRLYPELI